MATLMGNADTSVTTTNKVYIALAAVIVAVLLAIAYTTLSRNESSVPSNGYYNVN